MMVAVIIYGGTRNFTQSFRHRDWMAPRNESTCTDDEELVVSVTRISGVFNKRFGQTPLFKIVDNSHDGSCLFSTRVKASLTNWKNTSK